jgi:hypothetical protein
MFFILTVFAALPGLVLLYWLKPEVTQLDAAQEAAKKETA